MLKGIKVSLEVRTVTGTDELGAPTYTSTFVDVDNVLVAPVSANEMTQQSPTEFYGKKAIYQIAIPKGDGNEWKNRDIKFFGRTWHVIGDERRGIEALIPLQWNSIYLVENIDGEGTD